MKDTEFQQAMRWLVIGWIIWFFATGALVALIEVVNRYDQTEERH